MSLFGFTNEIEREFSLLWVEINKAEQPDAYFPLWQSFQLFDTKTGQLDETIKGKPQHARCIYCNKTVAAWGKAKPKRSAWSGGMPEPLTSANHTHTIPCAEVWAWKTLSRWALGDCRSSGEALAIENWRREISREVKNSDRYHPSAPQVLAMFDRLPSNDMAIVQAIEIFVASFGHELADADWKAFVHGTTEQHPHVFMPFQFADAEYGDWGMCPCGRIEWRGQDMPYADRLIGWEGWGEGPAARAALESQMRAFDLHEGPLLPMKPIKHVRHIPTSRTPVEPLVSPTQ